MTENAQTAARRLSAPALSRGFKPEALHEYVNQDGQIILYRIRLKNPDTGEKWIRPMHESESGFEIGEPKFGDAGKPLYSLDRIAAADPATPIYVTEGEKAADALLALGVIATTSGGADTADRADWTPLCERTCILWPDVDEPGREYAGNVAAILQQLNCTLRAVDVDTLGLPPKGDAWDWVRAHPDATLADLQALPTIEARSGGVDHKARAPGVGFAAAVAEDPPPVDILRSLAAPPLRVEDVPGVLGRFAEAHARATGFDVSILLAGGIGIAAAALSDEVRLCVSPRSSWFESARLWLSLVGGPGSGKSPGLKITAVPLFALHRELLGEWSRSNAGAETVLPDAPPRPALYTSDATTEALADVLKDNPRGLLYFCDELESWLASHDAYRSGGGGKDRGEWLRLYDGGPHQVNRVRRGAFFVPNWGVSLLSATTPAALRKLAPKLPDDGLLQRLLLVLARPRVLPDASMLRVETKPHTDAWNIALRRLYAAPARVVHLSADARDAFDAEQSELHKVTLAFEDLHPAFAAHMAKRAAMIARLALTFHALDADIDRDVGGDTMALAVRFMRRQECHAQAVYSGLLGAETGMALAKSIARTILAAELGELNRRDIAHKCKAFRSADEHTRLAALSLLADCGWLTCTANTLSHGALWIVDKRVHTLFSEHGDAAKAQREAVRSRLRGDDDDE